MSSKVDLSDSSEFCDHLPFHDRVDNCGEEAGRSVELSYSSDSLEFVFTRTRRDRLPCDSVGHDGLE